MASYNSILRHVSMADVKRNTWKLQEQKRIDEQRRQEELDLLKYKNSPLYSDWRFDLSENMTTQAMTYATTLPGEGDTVLGNATGWNDVSDSGEGGGISASGATLYINPNNIEYDDGPSTQQSVANTGAFDARQMTTAKVTLTRTRIGSGGDSNIRLFANYGSDPNQFYLLAFYGETGSDTRLINISQYQNLDKLRFQVRATRQKEPGDGISNVFPPADTSEYTLKVEFQRRTPITVFVAIDNPEASAFVRTGGFSEYSNEEKKKQLEQMMKASDEYLFSVYGDLFPGTGAVGFDDVADPTSWEQAAQGGDPNNIRWPKNSDGPKIKQYYDKHMKQWVTAPVKKASVGGGDEIAQEPSLMQKALEKQTSGETAPMPIIKTKPPSGGWKMPIVPADYDPNDETVLAGAKGPLPIQAPWNKWPTVPGGRPFPYAPGKGGTGEKYPMAKNNTKKNGKKKQPVVAHYEPEGEVIMERKLKKPQAFFKDKDIKPEFPENPPPPQIKGLHPDLVTGDSVSQRFNRLDPISARAMPRTGIKSVDKKVQIASKKPK